MADKAISELVSAEQITATDMFVLEQNGTAKKLTGQVLLNWLTAAADGHGGIQSIVKRSTSGLADTYRITLADTTFFDFVVTNGRGINSLHKTGTSGLVDTYTFTYNDGTKATFTVTNGQKGDKGDNAYIWVKYASQEPTASSNSFGDLPDDWMGVYFGTASTAPTNWQQYKWYRIKGEKGDTGEPATLVSSSVTYQVGDSGTIIPSGSWSESIPPVPQGKYLWTKEVTEFNTGNPITKYSVSRFGIDGSGAVSTVAGVSPDADGNVHLTAADVKALPIGGGTMEGPINMNGQIITGLNTPTDASSPATKGYADSKVDKTKVVNNFDTEEAGYVADARALKTLNDGKMSSMELLWKNGDDTSDFGAQDISFDTVDLSFYDGFYLVYKYGTTSGVKNTHFVVGLESTMLYMSNSANATNLYFRTRNVTIHDHHIAIGACYTHKYTDTTYTETNSYVIPIEIYGIKGVSA